MNVGFVAVKAEAGATPSPCRLEADVAIKSIVLASALPEPRFQIASNQREYSDCA
jgi:hypothetical protein